MPFGIAAIASRSWCFGHSGCTWYAFTYSVLGLSFVLRHAVIVVEKSQEDFKTTIDTHWQTRYSQDNSGCLGNLYQLGNFAFTWMVILWEGRKWSSLLHPVEINSPRWCLVCDFNFCVVRICTTNFNCGLLCSHFTGTAKNGNKGTKTTGSIFTVNNTTRGC